MWKKRPWPNLKYVGICLEGVRKSHGKPQSNNRCPGQRLNPGLQNMKQGCYPFHLSVWFLNVKASYIDNVSLRLK
jgi:hypothetical protein